MKPDETTNNTVLVFKTNLRYKKDVRLVSPHLSSNRDITRWSVAIDDRDKVLRVEAGSHINPGALAADISRRLNMAGFSCEELQ